LTKKGKKKKGYLKPELLFDLDGDCSIKTLHECNDKVCRKEAAKSELEGEEEEEESMSEDSTSKSNHTKLHQASALGEAEGTCGVVQFEASPSVEPSSQHDRAKGQIAHTSYPLLPTKGAQQHALSGACNWDPTPRCKEYLQSVGNRCPDGQSSGHRRSRNQKRAHKFCSQQESFRTMELIGLVGNRITLRHLGRLNNINH
jgi:hypothetical protein